MNHAADRARGQGTERERDQETNRETEQKIVFTVWIIIHDITLL